MFNIGVPATHKLNKMRESYARLLQAAKELNKADNPADVARLLGKTDQVVQNWKTRGVPPGELINIEEKIGALARWVATGRGAMTIKLANSTLTADQQQILTVMEDINPEARNALLHGLSLLSKSHQSAVADPSNPQREYGVKADGGSVELPYIDTDTYHGPDRRHQDSGHTPERRRVFGPTGKMVKDELKNQLKKS